MRNLFIVCSLILLSTSCNKSDKTTQCPEPTLDCASVTCLLRTSIFEFRLVDKASGADLVFGSSPRYTSANIKLYSDAAHTVELPIVIDASAKMIRTVKATSTMYLVISGAKTYKLDADFKNVDCCTTRVKNLTEDGVRRCTCCGDIIDLPVD
jgi:hypothetical protein